MLCPDALDELCSLYAGLLGLTEWKLCARYAGPGEIRPGSVGQLDWAKNTRGGGTATVLLLPSSTHDHVVTLVHELAHIPLLDCPPRGKRQAAAQEAAIDKYAIAIVAAAGRR
jgi:hypothetical protein